MKQLIILAATLSMVSCTSVKRDDHSYSYVYQHNEKPPETPKVKKVEYTTYKQEYTNYKNDESDPEFLDTVNKREIPVYSGSSQPAQVQAPKTSYVPQSKREFNPYDNQFINSSSRVNKSMEEQVPDVFGPEGYVMVSTKVPNSNPPIINNHYYPASKFR
jgi:hypothetical protein